VAPLEMNAGTCWEQQYNRPKMASVLKKLQKATFTFYLLLLGYMVYFTLLRPAGSNKAIMYE